MQHGGDFQLQDVTREFSDALPWVQKPGYTSRQECVCVRVQACVFKRIPSSQNAVTGPRLEQWMSGESAFCRYLRREGGNVVWTSRTGARRAPKTHNAPIHHLPQASHAHTIKAARHANK